MLLTQQPEGNAQVTRRSVASAAKVGDQAEELVETTEESCGITSS